LDLNSCFYVTSCFMLMEKDNNKVGLNRKIGSPE